MDQKFRKYLFKDPEIRQAVSEISVENYKSKEIPNQIIKRVFVLPDGVDLTPEEKEDFRIYVEYASKRLIGSSMQFLHPSLFTKENILEILKKEKPYLSFHDIIHSVITFEDKKKTAAGFATEYSINNIDLIAEELRVNMWEGIFSKYTIFIALMDEDRKLEWIKDFEKWFEKRISSKEIEFALLHKKVLDLVHGCDSLDFESVLETYQEIILLFTGDVNTLNFRSFFKNDKSFSKEMEEKVKMDYENIVSTLKKHPDLEFLRLAETVYFNYNKNPKILFDEFKRITHPLVDNLRKRKDNSENKK